MCWWEWSIHLGVPILSPRLTSPSTALGRADHALPPSWCMFLSLAIQDPTTRWLLPFRIIYWLFLFSAPSLYWCFLVFCHGPSFLHLFHDFMPSHGLNANYIPMTPKYVTPVLTSLLSSKFICPSTYLILQ